MSFPDESVRVRVVDPSPDWKAAFETLATRLRSALGELALAIDHVGSTSVPGLPAKDCIDAQVRVNAINEAAIASRLEAIGFRVRPEAWNHTETSFGETAPKLVFAPPPGERVVNVHVRLAYGKGARFALLFRDYLCADAAARDAWGAFKRRLSQTAPDLFDYGQIKQPATQVLMIAAERWAHEVGWSPPPVAIEGT